MVPSIIYRSKLQHSIDIDDLIEQYTNTPLRILRLWLQNNMTMERLSSLAIISIH